MASKGYRDVFRSTAPYYARYRLPYPTAFFDLLRAKFALDGSGRLLDLGCGTGQIAIPLAGDLEEVVAMDPEPEMLLEAGALARARGVTNITWKEAGSGDLEDLRVSLGTFRLATLGNSFHWMDREAALRILHEMIRPGGGIAIGGSGSDSRWTPPDTPAVIDAVVKRWLGDRRRAGSGFYDVAPERHEDFVRRSPFVGMEVHAFPGRAEWTLDEIVGSLYSTSYASPFVLREKREAFETELRAALGAVSPSGRFIEDLAHHAILAWRR